MKPVDKKHPWFIELDWLYDIRKAVCDLRAYLIDTNGEPAWRNKFTFEEYWTDTFAQYSSLREMAHQSFRIAPWSIKQRDLNIYTLDSFLAHLVVRGGPQILDSRLA